MEKVLRALKATAETTRLRILVCLVQIELTVSEICQVLGQSQPRVSRHLKLLCDAGLLERRAEGTSAFYRLATQGEARTLADTVLGLIDPDDPQLARDADRLAAVRRERAETAAEYFESVATDWERVRALHVADDEVERAMLAAAEGGRAGELLDIGTGTGRVLEIFADRVDRGLGVDLSREMLNVARSRLDERRITNCAVRHGDAYDLDVETGRFDIAVLHHVLHFLDDPETAISEAARALGPRGRLIVVDFTPHELELLRAEFSHRRLGFADSEIRRWFDLAGLVDVEVTHMAPETESSLGPDPLIVGLWVASQTADAPSFHTLEVA